MVRDVVERGARSSRSRLDGALLQRKHRDTMLELGEAVYELAVAGELGDLEDFPEITACLVGLEEIEEQIAEATERADREAAGIPTRPRSRRSRPTPERQEDSGQANSFRVWRPTLPDDDPLDDAPLDDEPAPPAPSAPPVTKKVARKPQRKAARSSRSSARADRGSGGIAFVDDEQVTDDEAELAEYMHDDDVPAAEDDAGAKDDAK